MSTEGVNTWLNSLQEVSKERYVKIIEDFCAYHGVNEGDIVTIMVEYLEEQHLKGYAATTVEGFASVLS
jgi:hypothetical protein